MARRGDDARAALVEQAERLFAERGIEGVSLRDVSAAAGQRNHSAAQYHFGDRGGLVAAVYHARMGVINDRRRARLDGLHADDCDEVAALIEAFVTPLVEVVAETDGWYGRFLARTRWDTVAWQVLVDLPDADGYRDFVRRLDHLLQHLPHEIRRSRHEQLLSMVVATVAGWEWARSRHLPHLPADVLTAELVTTSIALIGAPVLAAQH